MLDALPDIVTEFPDVVYIVLGVTHPNESRTNGEAYRVGLEAVVKKMSPRIRKYCIGAFLLDRDDPTKAIGRLPEPLIKPNATERNGDVPRVVHSCGGLVHGVRLIIHTASPTTRQRSAVFRWLKCWLPWNRAMTTQGRIRIRLHTSVGIVRQEITP